MRERTFTEFFITPIFSQINAMIDVALPIPRKIKAGNNNVDICIKIRQF